MERIRCKDNTVVVFSKPITQPQYANDVERSQSPPQPIFLTDALPTPQPLVPQPTLPLPSIVAGHFLSLFCQLLSPQLLLIVSEQLPFAVWMLLIQQLVWTFSTHSL